MVSPFEILPFPLDHAPLLWAWMNEVGDQNLDDSGPKNASELRAHLERRLAAGEELWEVLADGKPIGAIGYIRVTAELGRFHGICFTKEVHGSGIPFQAVVEVLRLVFARGTECLETYFFADNMQVIKFLKKLGFEDAGLIPRGSSQRGQLIDWRKAVIRKSSAFVLNVR